MEAMEYIDHQPMVAIRFRGGWLHKDGVYLPHLPKDDLDWAPWRVAYEKWTPDWFLERVEPQQVLIYFSGGRGGCRFSWGVSPVRLGTMFLKQGT